MIDLSTCKPRAAALGAVGTLVWVVSVYALLVDESLLYALAVVPRRFDGLAGVLGAPLVHGSFAHLVANTLPLLIPRGYGRRPRRRLLRERRRWPSWCWEASAFGCSDAARRTSAPAV